MSTFTVAIELAPWDGSRYVTLDARVDTGATTTVVAGQTLRSLGISPTRRETFEYADGRRVELGMAETRIRVQGKETTTWVIFGDDRADAILGAYTLEGVLLGVDPYNERLVPETGLLKQST